jgi:hypothetical protein
MILAVPHRELLARPVAELLAPVREGGLFLDLKAAVDPKRVRPDVQYWSL